MPRSSALFTMYDANTQMMATASSSTRPTWGSTRLKPSRLGALASLARILSPPSPLSFSHQTNKQNRKQPNPTQPHPTPPHYLISAESHQRHLPRRTRQPMLVTFAAILRQTGVASQLRRRHHRTTAAATLFTSPSSSILRPAQRKADSLRRSAHQCLAADCLGNTTALFSLSFRFVSLFLPCLSFFLKSSSWAFSGRASVARLYHREKRVAAQQYIHRERERLVKSPLV